MSDDLLIRYDNTDGAASWPTIPPGVPGWVSPAIELHGPAGATNTVLTGLTPADPGDPGDPEYQAITVKVGNHSPTQLRPQARVQLWVADFGVGNPWLGTLGGSAGVLLGPHDIPANAKLSTNTEVGFTTTWYPSAAAAGGTAPRHVCLLANVFNDGDGAQVTTPPAPGFDIVTNRHHAQRNITLAPKPAKKELQFEFHAGPGAGQAGRFTLEVVEETTKRLSLTDTRHLVRSDWLTAAQEELGKRFVVQPAADGLRLASEAGKSKRGLLHLELEAEQQVPVTIDLTPSAARSRFGVRRLSILQRNRAGDVVDGARVLLVTVPDEFIPPAFLAADPA